MQTIRRPGNSFLRKQHFRNDSAGPNGMRDRMGLRFLSFSTSPDKGSIEPEKVSSLSGRVASSFL
jgi:hypothetical protein